MMIKSNKEKAAASEFQYVNFEKRKTVILMIFLTPYCVSGTKKCLAKALFEATNRDMHLRPRLLSVDFTLCSH